MKHRREFPLSHFESYEEQELEDLKHGGQQPECERFAADVPHRWSDHSITRSWTPDED